MNRLELLGTKTKTTKATTTARNAKKTPKAQTVKPTTKNATVAKREKKGIETRQDNANAYQEDQPDRSRDRRTWQIEGRDELQSDGRGDAGRGSLVDTQRGQRLTRHSTLRSCGRSTPRAKTPDSARPSEATLRWPATSRTPTTNRHHNAHKAARRGLVSLMEAHFARWSTASPVAAPPRDLRPYNHQLRSC